MAFNKIMKDSYKYIVIGLLIAILVILIESRKKNVENLKTSISTPAHTPYTCKQSGSLATCSKCPDGSASSTYCNCNGKEIRQSGSLATCSKCPDGSVSYTYCNCEAGEEAGVGYKGPSICS